MFVRNAIVATVIALGSAGLAQAQEGPRLVGGGVDAEVVYGAAPRGSVVGGGNVALSGGGRDQSFTYGAVRGIAGRAVALVGGGKDAQLLERPATTATGLAGRGAPDTQG